MIDKLRSIILKRGIQIKLDQDQSRRGRNELKRVERRLSVWTNPPSNHLLMFQLALLVEKK